MPANERRACEHLQENDPSSQELVDALKDSSFRWNDLYRAQSMYKVEHEEEEPCDNTVPTD